MFDTLDDEKKGLVLLVAPWLPGAVVETLDIQESCSCYSEFTQDPCNYFVTFKAPWVGSDDELGLLIRSVLDSLVETFSEQHHTFQEERSCCEGRISRYVRVIPLRSKA